MTQPCVGDVHNYKVVTPNDWPEDFKHENGNYDNTCRFCQAVFVGYKRRQVCRVCATGKPNFENKEGHCNGQASIS